MSGPPRYAWLSYFVGALSVYIAVAAFGPVHWLHRFVVGVTERTVKGPWPAYPKHDRKPDQLGHIP